MIPKEVGYSIVDISIEEREYQHAIMQKYKELGVIPDYQTAARKSGASVPTVISFMKGNSTMRRVRDYMKVRFDANFKTKMPDDIKKLLEIWDRL